MSPKAFRLVLSFGLVALVTAGVAYRLSRTRLAADGKTYTYYSFRPGPARTVRELLEHYGVALGPKDIVRPDLDSPLHWGMDVRVVRVTERAEERVETVDFVLDWKRRTTKNLRPVEIQRGRREKKTWTVRSVYYDGEEVETEKKLKKTVKTPVDRLVFLNKRGFEEKIYDLSKAKKVRVVATAYWEGDPQVPGVITYSGHRVERGLVAVDPSVIPLGWRLYVPGYGYAYSSDTGSAIKGNRIDLFVENKKASLKWEYVKVDVYLLEKSKSW